MQKGAKNQEKLSIMNRLKQTQESEMLKKRPTVK